MHGENFSALRKNSQYIIDCAATIFRLRLYNNKYLNTKIIYDCTRVTSTCQLHITLEFNNIQNYLIFKKSTILSCQKEYNLIFILKNGCILVQILKFFHGTFKISYTR